MSKNLDTKIRETKELRPDSSPGSPFVAPARFTALAWAIMNESKAGRKVRCHKGRCGNLLGWRRVGKIGDVSFVPSASQYLCPCVQVPPFCLKRQIAGERSV